MRLRRTLAITLVAIVFMHPSTATAQTMTCEQGRNILLNTANPSRSDMHEAMAKVVDRCGDAAPGWVARMLRQATPLSTKDTVARVGAWQLLDRRLTDSLGVLANDHAQTTERRQFFLSLLVRYAAPNLVVDDGTLDSDAPAVLYTVMHPGGVPGTWPPNTQSKGVALNAIQQMASNDPEARLRKLAAQVAKELPSYMQ